MKLQRTLSVMFIQNLKILSLLPSEYLMNSQICHVKCAFLSGFSLALLLWFEDMWWCFFFNVVLMLSLFSTLQMNGPISQTTSQTSSIPPLSQVI